MLAGPNGAGKSTFYETFLAESPLPFLNADAFAAETRIDDAEAARVMDVTRDRMIADKLGFITETVFSDPVGAKLAMLKSAVAAGYDVRLIYIGLSSVPLSSKRIDQRIAEGGHDVPRDRLPRRYEQSLENVRAAIAFVSRVEIYDNSSATEPFRPIAVFGNGALVSRAKGRLPAWAARLVGRRR